MQMNMSWIERRTSTYRWLGFTAWLSVGRIGPIPAPNLPPQQWVRLPLAVVRQVAEAVGPWLLLVLEERQQRELGWLEERDVLLLPADLAARPCGAVDVDGQPGWLLWRIESELSRLLRLAEAPERALPAGSWMGMPSEVRYRALAVGLVRACQLYAALEEMYEREEATTELRAAAARVRQRATERMVAA